MKPAPFDYKRPSTIAECLDLLTEHGEDARMIAGGQSLMPMLALRLARPSVVVDLNWIADLAGIAVTKDVLCIGAMTRQAKVLGSADVALSAPLLVQTLHNVGHPPTRTRGTIGGSACHADPAAELPVALTALGATMVVRSAAGERRVATRDFFHSAFQTAIKTNEILAAIEVPRQAGSSGFYEVSPRRGDFAIASAAARVDTGDDGVCRDCTLVVGGIGERPIDCADAANALKGSRLDTATLAKIVRALPYDAVSMDSRLASAAYRRRILPVVVRRALENALKSGEAAAR